MAELSAPDEGSTAWAAGNDPSPMRGRKDGGSGSITRSSDMPSRCSLASAECRLTPAAKRSPHILSSAWRRWYSPLCFARSCASLSVSRAVNTACLAIRSHSGGSSKVNLLDLFSASPPSATDTVTSHKRHERTRHRTYTRFLCVDDAKAGCSIGREQKSKTRDTRAGTGQCARRGFETRQRRTKSRLKRITKQRITNQRTRTMQQER